jgi:hypothetical protein
MNPVLSGHCACGAVQFRVTAPFEGARYCHCHRCQHRTGSSFAASGRVPVSAFEVTAGEELIRAWRPPDGLGKYFCASCGGQLYARGEDADVLFVRLGAIDGDPGIRPSAHQWVSSAAPWEPIPDDGLPRYDGPAPG